MSVSLNFECNCVIKTSGPNLIKQWNQMLGVCNFFICLDSCVNRNRAFFLRTCYSECQALQSLLTNNGQNVHGACSWRFGFQVNFFGVQKVDTMGLPWCLSGCKRISKHFLGGCAFLVAYWLHRIHKSPKSVCNILATRYGLYDFIQNMLDFIFCIL